MLTVATELTVAGLTGEEVTDFLLHPREDRYRAWWPGTHLSYRLLRPAPRAGHVGDVVRMDEYVGRRRLRMTGEVVEVVPGERVVWRFRKWGLPLPARLTLTLTTRDGDVRLRHAVTAGWPGPGRVLDPVLRLWFSASFAAAMEQHVTTEFTLLRTHLRGAPG